MTTQSALIATGFAAFLLAAPLISPVYAKNAPGNNGSIKINGDIHNHGKGNQPHLMRSTFDLKFDGYDSGSTDMKVEFELKSPTKPGKLFSHGNLNPSIDGTSDIETYQLDFEGVTPHKKHGYHVKATVYNQDTKGPGTKHKVFWIKDCDREEEAVPTPTSTPVPTVTPVEQGKVSPVAASTSRPATAVLAAVATKPGNELPGTGASPIFPLLGLGLIASGIALKKIVK